MSEPYKVSILVPVYGVERYIERCARSIFEQTYQNLEIIFVDDCTPDKSIDVLQRVIEDYPERKTQTRIIRHEKNRGVSATRNTAVAAATGEFLSYVDSDDWIDKNSIALLVSKQDEDNADIVTGCAVKEYGTYSEELLIKVVSSWEDQIKIVLGLTLDHVIWARLIRRSLYIDHDIRAKEGLNHGDDAQVVPLLFFFAHKSSSLDRPFYHYNCCNNSSYTRSSSLYLESQLSKARQDIEDCLILKQFFQEHAPQFLSVINKNILTLENMITTIKCGMLFEACEHNDRQKFKALTSDLRKSNPTLVGNRIRIILRLHASLLLAKFISRIAK